MNDSNVADRLKTFIEKRELSYSQFADSCGIPRPSLSQLLTGRNKKINDIMVGQIHSTFPDLSIVWLLFGEGPMEVGKTDEEDINDVENGQNYDEGNFPIGEYENSGSKKIFFSHGGQQNAENRKENALNDGLNRPQFTDIERERLQKRIKELQVEIEKLKKNPRKAVRIMVYYDDNTFEEFFPNHQ